MTIVQTLSEDRARDAGVEAPSVEQLYREHADFVWACLSRFGIRDRDLDDASQEVFVVVHRRLASFRGDAHVRTWLYAISLRVASGARRRGQRRREQQLEDGFEALDLEQPSAEDRLALAERQRALEAVLDELELEQRALLVMFEIDELACEEIASILGVPVGTVYSRLHSARRAFQKAVARFRARVARGAAR